MSNMRNINFIANPFLAWTKLAAQTGEMMLASASVIQHRTGRMATAGAVPDARDRREFTLMGQEKVEAVVESAQAMVMQAMTMNPMMGMRAMELMLKGSSAMMSLATSATAGQSLKNQAALARVLTESANVHSELSHSAAKIAQHGLKPIHSRATSNAKRLAKVKK